MYWCQYCKSEICLLLIAADRSGKISRVGTEKLVGVYSPGEYIFCSCLLYLNEEDGPKLKHNLVFIIKAFVDSQTITKTNNVYVSFWKAYY